MFNSSRTPRSTQQNHEEVMPRAKSLVRVAVGPILEGVHRDLASGAGLVATMLTQRKFRLGTITVIRSSTARALAQLEELEQTLCPPKEEA